MGKALCGAEKGSVSFRRKRTRYTHCRLAKGWEIVRVIEMRIDRHPKPKRVHGRARAELEWRSIFKGANHVS